MAIFYFLKMVAAAILDFWYFEFLTIGRDQSVELRHRAKFPNMLGLLPDPVL